MIARLLILVPALVAAFEAPAALAQFDWQPPPPIRPYIRRLPDVMPTTHPLPTAPGEESSTEIVVEEIVVEEIPDVWSGSFEFGMAGTRGSSETFNTRFGIDAKAETPGSILTFDLDYKKESADGTTTANRLFFELRHEWEFDDSPWGCFVHSTFEFDDFKKFDYLVAADGGWTYTFFNNDITKFKGRFGAGASREVGAPNSEAVPEALIGANFSRKINDWQKFKMSCDYFPSWEDFSMFRLTARADWELVLSAENNLSLKVGVVDRYDPSPNSGEENNIDYSSVILWKF